jgi:ABC-type transport system involved in cytochrome bd biosynthesis fused ATPase/permease subunit
MTTAKEHNMKALQGIFTSPVYELADLKQVNNIPTLTPKQAREQALQNHFTNTHKRINALTSAIAILLAIVIIMAMYIATSEAAIASQTSYMATPAHLADVPSPY